MRRQRAVEVAAVQEQRRDDRHAGRGLIASRTVKVVFVLDSATLHACEIGAA